MIRGSMRILIRSYPRLPVPWKHYALLHAMHGYRYSTSVEDNPSKPSGNFWKHVGVDLKEIRTKLATGLIFALVSGIVYFFWTKKEVQEVVDLVVPRIASKLQQPCVVPSGIFHSGNPTYVELDFVKQFQKQLDDLQKLGDKPGPWYYVLVGPSRIGKTTAVCNAIRGRPNIFYVPLGQDLPDVNKHMAEAFGVKTIVEHRNKSQNYSKEEQLANLRSDLIAAAETAFAKTKTKPVIIFDGFNHLLTASPEMGKIMTAFLRYLAESKCLHVFCMLSETAHATYFPDSNPFRILQYISPFTEAQAKDYLTKSLKQQWANPQPLPADVTSCVEKNCPDAKDMEKLAEVKEACMTKFAAEVSSHIVARYSVEVGRLDELVAALPANFSLKDVDELVEADIARACTTLRRQTNKDGSIAQLLPLLLQKGVLYLTDCDEILKFKSFDRDGAFFTLFQDGILNLNYSKPARTIELRHKFCEEAVQRVIKGGGRMNQAKNLNFVKNLFGYSVSKKQAASSRESVKTEEG